MSVFFNYNGRVYKEDTPVITPDNRSLCYGDGLFETLKMVHGKLLLKEYHFERLFYGMQILTLDLPPHFTAAFLESEIASLAKKNGHNKTARVRLMVFRTSTGQGKAYNHLPEYIIQTWNLNDNEQLNEDGLLVDLYPHAKKSCDILANLKTNNFLSYSLAAIYAKKIYMNDCIVLNTYQRICDSSVANIFIIKDDIIYTPSLREGCIAGTMRKYLIEIFNYRGVTIKEKPVTVEDLKNADEVFLTNSIHPIRWVKQFGDAQYTNKQTQYLYTLIDQTF